MYQCIKFYVFQAKGSQDIERSVHSYVQFAPLDLKINTLGVIYFLACTSVLSLKSIKQRVL
jgi:hypothetical protein